MATPSAFDYSPYAKRLLSQYSELELDHTDPILKLEHLIEILPESVAEAIAAGEGQAVLLEHKAIFAWHWMRAEVTKAGSFEQRGALWTRFAEVSIHQALIIAWRNVADKQPQIAKALQQHPDGLPGLFILGLGKLGGLDLNFSSDADLIGFYDPHLLPVPETLGPSYICHQVLQALTSILGRKDGSDFVWRVDWRLRPNASATTLAMSTRAAQEYYFYQASPWHRLALMKARVIAGDQAAGDAFLAGLAPFIWRQNLDYRALDELGEIKNKIKREHPSLRAERQWQDAISEDVGGFNVKLGTGGIREVEFIANALQLVWGGKHKSLQTPNTVAALKLLGEKSLLEPSTVVRLMAAYRYLRRLENALQMVENQQTHALPNDPARQQAVLSLLALEDWASLVAELNDHRTMVSQEFSDLFADQATASYEELEWPTSLSTAANDIIKNWERGFLAYGVSRDMRSRLRPLLSGLANSLAPITDASSAVLRLHDFFRSLPRGEQYFRLLAESPGLLNHIVKPLMHSPPMSRLLKQSPHIIDCFLDADRLQFERINQRELEFESGYIRQTKQYENQLELMRRFVNENLYQLYLGFLEGKLEPSSLHYSLTQLANHTLQLALDVVAEDMGLPNSPVAAIGLGKMGVGRMAPESDLDLIFVFDPNQSDLDTATKFVSRLQTAVSTPMREGVVYELDTRLRPSGRSGAPTVSIESFRQHQLSRARTWEHIALVSGAVISASPELEQQIYAVKKEVLAGGRDPVQFLADAKKMWLRISEHRIKSVQADSFNSKLRIGGLMQAEYLAACQVLQNPEIGSDVDFYSRLAEIDRQPNDQTSMLSAIKFWQVLQLWERLLGMQDAPLASVPDDYRPYLLSHLECENLSQLEERQHQVQQLVEAQLEQFFQPIAVEWDAEQWQEAAVNWLS